MTLIHPSRAAELTPQQRVAQAASMPSVHRAFEWFRLRERELREQQMELTAIPAPPFGEQRRAEWLRNRFRALGLQEVEIDEVGNVIALRKGRASGKAIAISAHIDTVFPPETNVQVFQDRERLHGPGISDNAAGVTAMIALAAALGDAGIPHESDLLFIGNVGEEGEGDLRGMRHIFSQEKWRRRIAHTVVLDGTGTDSIVTEGLGSRRFEVMVTGPGGHSWNDFGAPNPIVILARAIASFSQTQVPASPKTTFNIGTICGGTSVNSIPESAKVRVDLRSASLDEIRKLEEALLDAVSREAATMSASGEGPSQKVTATIKKIGDRPAAELPPKAYLLQAIRAVDSHLGISSHFRRASTDANIPLSLGMEAISIGAGGQGGGAHTLHEWYDPTGRVLALKRILLLALVLAGVA